MGPSVERTVTNDRYRDLRRPQLEDSRTQPALRFASSGRYDLFSRTERSGTSADMGVEEIEHLLVHFFAQGDAMEQTVLAGLYQRLHLAVLALESLDDAAACG